MAADDISINAGDTRYESITITDDATPPSPINLTDATNIVWVATSSGRVILRKHLTDNSIVITNAAAGQLLMTITSDDTSTAFGIGSTTTTNTYPYELRVYFSDNTQELVINGAALIVNPSTSCGTEATTLVDSIAQGVF
jgi:hypothetical protein